MQLLLHTEGEQWATEKGPWAECKESDFYLLGKQGRKERKEHLKVQRNRVQAYIL